MSQTERNRQIILEFFRLSECEDGDVSPLLADDLKWWVPGDWALSGTYSKAEVAEVFGRAFSLLDGRPRMVLHNITAEEDRVAVEASSHGRFKDGGPFGNRYHFLFVLRDGQIVEAKEYFDTGYMEKLVAQRPAMVG